MKDGVILEFCYLPIWKSLAGPSPTLPLRVQHTRCRLAPTAADARCSWVSSLAGGAPGSMDEASSAVRFYFMACSGLKSTILIQYLISHIGVTILDVAYGIKPLPDNDPLIDLVDKTVAMVTPAALPGRFLVEILPILKYVPAWMPGASFMRLANEVKPLLRDVADIPFEKVKQAMVWNRSPRLLVSLKLIFNYQGQWVCDTIIHVKLLAKHRFQWRCEISRGRDQKFCCNDAFRYLSLF